MSNVSISVEIAAPADRVWAIVGGFNGLPAWLAPVRTSRLSDDGKTRHLEIGTDTRIVEQLLEHSDADRRYSYSILEGPDPVVTTSRPSRSSATAKTAPRRPGAAASRRTPTPTKPSSSRSIRGSTK
ncbi:SRPBCC family protein [Burkholderia gladioli]